PRSVGARRHPGGREPDPRRRQPAPPRPLSAPGGDRRLPRRGPDLGGYRLEADPPALRGAPQEHAHAGGAPEPRGGGELRGRARRGPARGGRPGAGARPLPPLPRDPGGPAAPPWPARGG